jgi:hypothetical protein
MTPTHTMFRNKAGDDSGYAIAFALLEIATQLSGVKHEVAGAIESVATAIVGLQDSLRSDHPLQGETFDGLCGSLDGIAEAIGNAKDD